MGLRVTLLVSAPQVVAAVADGVRAAGHEPVAVVAVRVPPSRYAGEGTAELVAASPPDLDVLAVASAGRLPALLAATGADVGLCATFPVRIPPEGLAAFPRGIVNVHPSLLPRHRGPNPIGWTLRLGDPHLGMSAHVMDVDLDTGPLLAQHSLPLARDDDRRTIEGKLFELGARATFEALALVEAGAPGRPQPAEGATDAPFFEEAYAEVDWTQPAEEIHAQVRAWWFAGVRGAVRGPLADLGGERVRVLRSRLDGAEGGERVECGSGALWVLETEPVHVGTAA